MEDRIRALGEEIQRLRRIAENADPQTRAAFLELAGDMQRHMHELQARAASDDDQSEKRP